MFNLFGLVNWYLRGRMKYIRQFAEFPHETQETVLKKLMLTAKDTEFGKQYDFASIKNAKEFSERIPLSDYDSFKPQIERMMHGEQNIVWPSRIRWFAKSSGTASGRSKFIPVSVEAINDCHYLGGIDFLTAYCNNHSDSSLFTGKGLIVGGSHQISHLDKQTRYGDLSAVLLQNMSFMSSIYRTPDLSIALMDDWEKKLTAMALATMNENVTNVSGVPTWTIFLAKKIMELRGKETLKEVWPNLELYIHGGVSFTPYREQFTELMGSDTMRYYEIYNASEGFFSFQDVKDSDDMLLHLNNGVYYEFIPFEELHQEEKHPVPLEKVEVGKNYGLVISTNSGLWRYVIGDTIQFTEMKPYRIRVSGRISHFINAFGEEVIADNTDRAMAEACHDTSAIVRDYTVAPMFITRHERGRHQWLVEFETLPDDLSEFAQILDNKLRAHNSDYDAKRQKDIALSRLELHALPKGTFYEWLKKNNKLGGQHKIPRLNNDRKLAEEILLLVAE